MERQRKEEEAFYEKTRRDFEATQKAKTPEALQQQIEEIKNHIALAQQEYDCAKIFHEKKQALFTVEQERKDEGGTALAGATGVSAKQQAEHPPTPAARNIAPRACSSAPVPVLDFEKVQLPILLLCDAKNSWEVVIPCS